jgi:hypothetical protein
MESELGMMDWFFKGRMARKPPQWGCKPLFYLAAGTGRGLEPLKSVT